MTQFCPACGLAMTARPESMTPRPDRIIEGIRWRCGCGCGFFEFRTIRKMEVADNGQIA